MLFKQFQRISVAFSVVLFATTAAFAAPVDDALLAAYDAYRAGDPIKLARHAKKLEGQLLEPWVDYWRLALTLEDASTKDVPPFFAQRGAPDERSLAEAARQPKRLLARLPKTLEHRATREVAVLAGVRYAKSNPDAMAAALEGAFGERLPERELKYLWSRVAYEGALVHHDHTLRWYARAGDAKLDDELLGWKARAALRRAKWATVRKAIDRMSPASRTGPVSTYA